MNEIIKKKISLQSLSREFPPQEEIFVLLSSISEMDSRAAVLIITSILDHMMESAISLFFVDLSEKKFTSVFRSGRAPFSDLSSKIIISNALGILDDDAVVQLQMIRRIRNAFAHTVRMIDFDSPVIADECNKLDPSKVSRKPFDAVSPKEKFIGTATLIGMVIARFTKERANAIDCGSYVRPSTYVCNFD